KGEAGSPFVVSSATCLAGTGARHKPQCHSQPAVPIPNHPGDPMSRYTLPREHKGEWAEIEFLSKAHARGFIVSRPWGQNAPYDFIVQRHRLLHRIQVKSVWSKHN